MKNQIVTIKAKSSPRIFSTILTIFGLFFLSHPAIAQSAAEIEAIGQKIAKYEKANPQKQIKLSPYYCVEVLNRTWMKPTINQDGKTVIFDYFKLSQSQAQKFKDTIATQELVDYSNKNHKTNPQTINEFINLIAIYESELKALSDVYEIQSIQNFIQFDIYRFENCASYVGIKYDFKQEFSEILETLRDASLPQVLNIISEYSNQKYDLLEIKSANSFLEYVYASKNLGKLIATSKKTQEFENFSRRIKIANSQLDGSFFTARAKVNDTSLFECLIDEATRPKITSINSPANFYPSEALKKGISGEVRIKVLVDENGTPSNPHFIYSSDKIFELPQLLDSYMTAIYQPGRKDCVAITDYIEHNIKFQLE